MPGFRIRPPFIGLLGILLSASSLDGQPWEQDDLLFNPSGVPSLAFSQPRFADLDADGDFDLILGSIDEAPLYFINDGSATSPSFHLEPEVFWPVSALDAEVGVCADLDSDLDLDFVSGGFSGLNLFENIGDVSQPSFHKVDGFFQGMTVGYNPVPTCGDIDGDGDHDLLVGLSEDGRLKFYVNTGTPDSAVFSELQSQMWFDVGLYAYPWFADLDTDDDLDLLVGRDGTGFFYYRNVGDVTAWQWQPDNAVFSGLAHTTYWNSPCLVDLSGDGNKDLVYGTAAGPLNYYINTGSPSAPTWTVESGPFGGVIDVGGASSPFLFDFDGDGDLDLVSGTQLGNIKYYQNTGSAQTPAWEPDHARFSAIDHSIYSAICLGDADGDSLPDAVVGDMNGQLFFHRNTGTSFVFDESVLAGIDVGYTSVPRLTDMDADGDLDLVAGNEAGNLFYFRNTGDAEWPEWTLAPGFFGGIDVGSYCSLTMGDLDGDGDRDLVTGNISHEIQFFRNVAGMWIEDPTVVAGIFAGQNAAPAFGDLDEDGDLDLTIGNYEGTFNYYQNMISVDSTPPEAVSDLTVALAGSLFALQWSAVTADTAGAPETVDRYVVYRGDWAYFVPTAAESLGATSGTSYADSSSFSPSVNVSYLVKALDANGNWSAESNRVGEFDLELLSAKGAAR
ncbi:VCBS repeat-containing protein [Candidatus Fermentibacteria bacterium]|nr:VCBS repeat-containing protein [Candidatus Fermentibacteria bacterium]